MLRSFVRSVEIVGIYFLEYCNTFLFLYSDYADRYIGGSGSGRSQLHLLTF